MIMKEKLPLTSTQKGIWYDQMIHPGSAAYTISGHALITGEIDAVRFQEAVNELIRESEPLRTSFEMGELEPYQQINDHSNYEVGFFDLSGEANPGASALELMKKDAGSFIPLEGNAHLYTFSLFRISQDQYYWYIKIHHLIADGWSLGVIFKRLSLLYADNGGAGDAGIHYKDCLQEAIAYARSAAFEEDSHYWQEKFDGATGESLFPRLKDLHAGRVNLRMKRADYEKILVFCKEQDVTVFHYFLAALYVYLSRTRNCTDLVVGTPVGHRSRKSYKNTIGAFFGTIPLRFTYDTELSFSALLSSVRAEVKSAYRHKNFPVSEVTRILKKESGNNDFSLFDIQLSYEKQAYASKFSSFDAEVTYLPNEQLSHALFIHIMEHSADEDINIAFDYNHDCFREEEIGLFISQYHYLLLSLTDMAETAIGQIDIVSNEEKNKILFDFNDTATGLPENQTVIDIIQQQAKETPGHIALICGSVARTYSELNENSERYATFIKGLHIEQETVVAVMMDRSPAMVEIILAIWKAGGVYLPVDPAYPHNRVKYMLASSSAKLLVFEKAYLRLANLLKWECDSLENTFCIDSHDVSGETEYLNESMSKDLWEFVAENATDDIAAGGWKNSYTLQPFSREEMDEYSRNALIKLSPYLHKTARVLEIGCGSGITMFNIAPRVKEYCGTDMSETIIRRNGEIISRSGINNITLKCMYAHEIHELGEARFDLIIINSVIQNFRGYNYLDDVVHKCIDLLDDKGLIFFGDIMDLEKKDAFIKSLVAFKAEERAENRQAKTDWSEELFVPQKYFSDLASKYEGIAGVEFSGKIHSIENELTRFRYDVVMKVRKTGLSPVTRPKHRNTYDLSAIIHSDTGSDTNLSTPSGLAYIIFTSGSTGEPKAAMVEHIGMLNHIYAKINSLGLDQSAVIAQNAPQSFDISIWQMFTALLSGGTTVIYPKELLFDTELFVAGLKTDRVTILELVPSHLAVLLNTIQENSFLSGCFDNLQYLLVTGEVVKPEQVNGWLRLFPGIKVVNAYGPTEASDDITHYFIDKPLPLNRSVPIGKPVQNMHIYICDDHMRLSPIGCWGEICVSGTGVGRGYFNDAGKTRRSFTADHFHPGRSHLRMYKTGDVGRYMPDGNIELLGRKDYQVKIRGHRIELEEIARCIQGIPAIGNAVVLDMKDEKDESYLVAYYTLAEVNGKPIEEEIKSILSGELPEYMVPGYFILLPQFPLTRNGKIDRAALPAPEKTGTDIDIDELPRNDAERKILSMWHEMLDSRSQSIHQNFFLMGGHSLKATQLVSRINKSFDIKISIKDVFENPTVAALAEVVAKYEGKKHKPIPVSGLSEYYELSPAQKRIWVLSTFDQSASVIYNLPVALVFEGKLDKEALGKSFGALVRRHESLRTVFVYHNEEPRQRIISPEDFVFSISEYDYTNEENATEKARELAAYELTTAFDLSNGPLIRAKLIAIDDDKHIFLFTIHHLVTDRWSADLLISEIKEGYAAYKRKTDAVFAGLPVQYRDFVQWQKQLLASDELEAQRSYWRETFKGDLPVLDLPLDKPRPRIRAHNGGSVEFTLDKDLVQRLKKLAGENDCTLFTVLFAAINLLLHRYTEQKDIIVGTPVAGRVHPDLEKQIGFYLNTLPIRTSFGDKETFLTLLEKIRLSIVKAFENQEYPFDSLVEDLKLEREMSRTALFDVMVFYEEELPVPQLEDLKVSHFIKHRVTDNLYDIIVDLHEDSDCITGYLDYNADIFDQARMLRMAGHLSNIMREITLDPQGEVDRINILSGPEKENILDKLSRKGNYGRGGESIISLFDEAVEQHRDKVALVFGNEELTYNELNQRANRFAHYLISRYGLKKNDKVGIYFSRSTEMIVAILGILKAGAGYVALDPYYPKDRLMAIIKSSAVKFVVVDNGNHDIFSEYENVLINYHRETKQISACEITNPGTDNHPDDLFYIVYTSGTTGIPNGAMLSHGVLYNLLMWHRNSSGIEGNSRCLQFTSINFCVSFQEIFTTLTSGGKLFLIGEDERKDINYLIDFITVNKIEVLYLPFTYLNVLFNQYESWSGGFVNPLKHIITAGEQLTISSGLKNYLETYPSVKLHNHYGSSETHVVTSYTLDAGNYSQHAICPIGKPISNTATYILDSFMNPVPVGVWGMIHIGNATKMLGYVNNDLLNTTKYCNEFEGGSSFSRLYRTGDIGRWKEDGNIEYRGRKDVQVKIRGFRIECGEIESHLLSMPEIEEATVVVNTDNSSAQYITAFVIAGSKLNTSEISMRLQEKLPDYMLPSFIIQVDKFPLNPNGKIDRAALPDPLKMNIVRESAQPRNETEHALAQIWKDVLGVETIGINDNFFLLGGHSLRATKLIVAVNKKFGLRLELRSVFTHPTIEAQASLLSSGMQQESLASIPPAASAVDYTLSSSQERLWILSRFEEANIAYNMPGAYVLEGELDSSVLDSAFASVIERHEILRTVFRENEKGIVRQYINRPEDSGFSISRLDWTGEENPEDKLDSFVNEESRKPFDLARGPLLRTSLVRTGEHKWVLVFVMHHIISDGWSMGLMINELLTFYDAHLNSAEKPYAPLRIQYKDYAEWQQKQVADGSFNVHKKYWLEQFSGSIPVLAMPVDYPRPAIRTFKGGVVGRTLDKEAAAAIRSLCKADGITLFTGLLAAVKTLLYRYTGQEDIVVGAPIAEREHPDLEHQLGFYVNTIALRTRFSGEDDFRKLLHHVKQVALGAYAHQAYPFNELVNQLPLARDMSRNALFDVMVTFRDAETDYGLNRLDLNGVKIKEYPVSADPLTKFDLVFNFSEEGDDLHVSIEYDASLYQTHTIFRMVGHMEQLLCSVAGEPGRPLSKLNMLPPQERKQILSDFNNSRVPYPLEKTVVALFDAQVLAAPHNPAVISGNSRVSYSELQQRANRFCNYLLDRQVMQGDIVAVKLDRSIDLLVVILGVMKAGAVYLPVDSSYPADRIDFILADSGSKLLVDDQQAEEFRQKEQEYSAETELRSNAHDLAYVVYTSGSTGEPKGVMIEHRSLSNLCHWHRESFSVSADDRAGLYAGVAFDASIWEIFPYLAFGASLYIIPAELRLDMNKLAEYFETNKLTITFLPTQAAMHFMRTECSSLRYLLAGGDQLTSFEKKSYSVVNNYGPTENTVVTTSCVVNHNASGIPIGKPVSNTNAYIMSAGLELCPIGVVGEICISGAGLARGYLNRADLTAEKFVPHPFHAGERLYRTGDLGRWLPDGNIEFMGRSDDQVKIRGYRIELGEIETALQKHTAVLSASAAVKTNKHGEKELVAYLVSKTPVDIAALRSHLSNTLPAYMIPSHFVQMEDLPVNANGKIDRRQLPAPAEHGMSASADYVAPRNPVEEKLVIIWQEILEKEKVGVTDNFFELGGHSLKAIKALYRIRDEFSINVKIEDVFSYSTIELIAAEIIRKKWLAENTESKAGEQIVLTI